MFSRLFYLSCIRRSYSFYFSKRRVATSVPSDLDSAIFLDYLLIYGLKVAFENVPDYMFYFIFTELDLTLILLYIKIFLSGRERVLYRRPAASIKSYLSRLIPKSSISTNKGVRI